MSKEITQTSENVYEVYKQNVEKYHEEVERNIPKYFQSLATIQEEPAKEEPEPKTEEK